MTCLAFAGLASISSTASAQAPPSARAFWVELPRSAVPSDLDGFTTAPPPNERALARRAARGVPAAVAVLSRPPDVAALRELAAHVRRVRFVSRWLASAAVEVDAAQLADLRARYGAGAVRPVRRWIASPPPAEPVVAPAKRAGGGYGASLSQIQQLQVDQMQALGFTGRGVRVLVLDTGFYTDHEAFGQLDVVDTYDFVFDDPVVSDEAEDVAGQDNHGTRVLSALAGYAPGELIGPAYAAEFLLAKTEYVGSETEMEEDNFVAGLEWGEALGADLATASLGYRSFDDGFTYPPEALDGDTAVTTRAMDAAAALGLVCVAAAGNSGPDPMTLLTPADGDSVLAVGAVDSTGWVRNFSSRGPTYDGRHKPDVCAQGWLDVGAVVSGGFAATLSGTSAAAPLVAGAATLLLEGHPEWTAHEVLEALRSTATESTSPDDVIGYGIVQTLDAFEQQPAVFPYPFELLEPADGTSGAGPSVTFRWTRAFDAQTPASIAYGIQFSTSTSFADTVGWWWAGSDSTRTLDFLPVGSFHWRVVANDPDGHVRSSAGRSIEITSATASDVPDAAAWVRFLAPAPNPFNPSVRLGVVLAHPAAVALEVFDLAGRRVLRRPPKPLPAGEHAVVWSGQDDGGREVSSGVYLARLRVDDGRDTPAVVVRRLTLVR